ncbi:MAG: hypothetical protein CMP75_02720 [Flavobacteriales bacterium]|nr:hypothetical protein [Flavobacteriales bacterium]|tara:strand:- start:1135 stop:1596 length:462 start_codon:yes stop_codon:yes gene_type:complete
MKNICIGILSLVLVASCGDMAKKVDVKEQLSTDLVTNSKTAQIGAEEEGMPAFNFEKEEYDFGTLIDGEKVTYSFRFTNSGDAPLIISNAKGSCGCTVPNYPKEPIAPGSTASIDVTFDSKGRTGKQSKAVTLTANTNPNRKVIRIHSEVITE